MINVMFLLINEVEKAATSKWKKVVKTAKAVMYGVLIVRIVVALYVKVHEDNESYDAKIKL
jgi:hypothetical protein